MKKLLLFFFVMLIFSSFAFAVTTTNITISASPVSGSSGAQMTEINLFLCSDGSMISKGKYLKVNTTALPGNLDCIGGTANSTCVFDGLYDNGKYIGLGTGGGMYNTTVFLDNSYDICTVEITDSGDINRHFDFMAWYNDLGINITSKGNPTSGVPVDYYSKYAVFVSNLSINSTSITLTSPINNSRQNTYSVFDFESPAEFTSCTLYGNFSGIWSANATVYDVTPTQNTSIPFIATLPTGQYLWNVFCDGAGFAVSNYTFYVDYESPRIDINPNNFFDSNNLSTVTDYSGLVNMTVNISVFSNETDLYGFLFNISYPNGTTRFSEQIETLFPAKTFNYTTSINFSRWATNINYTVDVWASDAHTAKSIPDYDIISKNSQLTFKTAEGNVVDISTTDTSTMTAIKSKDRYNFAVAYNDKLKKSRTFEVKSDNKIIYLPQSTYKAHFVISNGKKGNWIDFEGINGTPVVIKVNDFHYRVTFESLGDVTVKSIGGLNTAHIASYWYLNAQPSINSINITSSFGYNPTLIESSFIGNANGTSGSYSGLQYDFIWYRNGIQYSNGSVTDQINNLLVNLSTLPSYTASINDNWVFSVRAVSAGIYSAYINSTPLNFTDWNISACASYNKPAINFTGLYENNQSAVNVTISSSSILSYSVYGFTTTKIIYPSVTNVDYLQYCLFPNWTTLDLDYSLNYVKAGDTTVRSRSGTGLTVSSSLTTIPLYVLSSETAGIVTIVVYDAFNSPISGATVTATRNIGGTDYVVQTEVSDSAGVTTFYLDTTQTYTINAVKSGYSVGTLVLNKPSIVQQYTIYMGSQTTTVENMIGSYVIDYSPNQFTELTNNTYYNFTVNLTSSVFDLSNCIFSVITEDGYSTSLAGTANTSFCTATILLNTGLNESIDAQVSFKLNATSFTGKAHYTVSTWTQGEYSFQTVIDDLYNFGGAGFDWKSRMLLAFIIIFGLTAFLSWKFNTMLNPENSMYLLATLILLFSMMGWLELHNSPLNYQGFGVLNPARYMIFVLSSMLIGAYLLMRHNQ